MSRKWRWLTFVIGGLVLVAANVFDYLAEPYHSHGISEFGVPIPLGHTGGNGGGTQFYVDRMLLTTKIACAALMLLGLVVERIVKYTPVMRLKEASVAFVLSVFFCGWWVLHLNFAA